jgi:hypothetical protein
LIADSLAVQFVFSSCFSSFRPHSYRRAASSMADRDWRSDRDKDRHSSQEESNSGGGGGRYNRALQRRDVGGGGGRRRSTSRERATPMGGDSFYPDVSDSYRPPQRARMDNGGYDNNAWLHQQPFMQSGFNAGGSMYGTQQLQQSMPYSTGFPYCGMAPPPQQQQPFHGGGNTMMQYGMPGVDPSMNTGVNGNGMDPAELLQFLLQQQQQQPQPQQPVNSSNPASPVPDTVGQVHHSSHEDVNDGGYVPNSAPAAARVLPSVDEFVPVVPKSLLNLVRGGASSASPHPEGGVGGNGTGSHQSGSPPPASSAGGALVLLEAPKIGPEADRRAREQRRAHISGFPSGTTKEELEDFFRLLLPEVRRLKTEREMHELAERTGLLSEEDGERHIPANANLSGIDEVRDLTLNQGRVKPFGFIELRLADMIDELVQQCQTDPQRFPFPSALDGRVYPLTIRRPRDTEPLAGVDESKVVVTGFPLTITVDVLKALYESFGKLLAFELKNGYAYGEFAELRDATEFRADVHGQVLGNSMVVALPLYDWLKVLLVREGLDITIADDDPVSGSYVMKQVRERLPDAVPRSAQAGAGTGGDGGSASGGGAAGSKSTALVIAEDPAMASLQIMRELLGMSFSLPDMLARFAALYPHLRPLYGNTQVTLYPTPILVLLNLFDEEELIHDSTYSRLLADIEEEVEKYGRVRQLVVPRREARPKLPEAPKPGVDYDETDEEAKAAAMAAYAAAKQNFGAVLGRYMNRQTHPVWGGYGRVFVEYETVDEAAEAQQQIAGKLFGERTVVTSFLYPDLLKEEEEEEEKEEAEKDAAASEHHHDSTHSAEETSDVEGDVDAPADYAESGDDEKGEEAAAAAATSPSDDDDVDDDVAKSAAAEHAEDID